MLPLYKEQGTSRSGYQELGPYHCEDCIHKVHPSVPICVHPVVIEDPELKDKKCWTDNPGTHNKGVFIDLKKGCCTFVNQSQD